MKRILSVLLVAVVFLSVAFAFKDVPTNHWAYKAVVALTKLGILSGYPDNTFRGANTVNRYQLAVALYKMVIYMQEYVGDKIKDSFSYNLAKEVSKLSDMTSKTYKWAMENSKEIGTLKSEMAEIKAKLNKLDTDDTLSGSDILNELASLKSSFEVKLMSFDSKYSEKVSNLEKRIKELEDAMETFSEKSCKNNSSEIKDYSADVNDLKKEINGIKIDIYALKKNFSDLEAKVDGMESKVSGILNKIKENSAMIGQIKSDFEDFSNRLSELEKAFSETRKMFDSFNVKIENLKNELSSVKGKNEFFEKKISDFETRLKKLEERKDTSSSLVVYSYLFSLLLFGIGVGVYLWLGK